MPRYGSFLFLSILVQMMRSYFNNEKATADTITDDSWLHTGDIVEFSVYLLMYKLT